VRPSRQRMGDFQVGEPGVDEDGGSGMPLSRKPAQAPRTVRNK
jgi:hypothetical protein